MSKILLVEDNPDAVKRIIRYINKIFAELDVVSFPEAGDALQYAKANDISLFTRTYLVETVTKISSSDWSYLSSTADNRITLFTCVAGDPSQRWCVQAVQAS